MVLKLTREYGRKKNTGPSIIVDKKKKNKEKTWKSRIRRR